MSWRTLLQDITTVYRQLTDGEPVVLPAKTTSYKRWSELLAQYGATANLQQDAEFWIAKHTAGPPPLPIDHEGGENRVGSIATISVELEKLDTEVLHTRLSMLFNTRIEEVLLAVLSRAISQWTRQPSVLIDLEGHGREALFEDVDLSRTIGWFTSIAPLRLEVPTSDVEDLLTSVKEQVRAIPKRGISYGILRYLSSDDTLRQSLAALRTPEIAFNYLGRFGGQEGARGSVTDDLMAVGATRSPQVRRLHKLELNGYVLNGRLIMNFDYSTEIHRPETIEQLARNYQAAVSELVQLGQTAKERRKTASDFERARLSQRDFGKLMERLARKVEKGD